MSVYTVDCSALFTKRGSPCMSGCGFRVLSQFEETKRSLCYWSIITEWASEWSCYKKLKHTDRNGELSFRLPDTLILALDMPNLCRLLSIVVNLFMLHHRLPSFLQYI